MRLVNLDLLTYFWGKLKTYFVKQESGKTLTSNDYTTEEKNKLASIQDNAQVNVIESIKLNGTALSVSGKAVNVDLSNYVQKRRCNYGDEIQGFRSKLCFSAHYR